METVHCLRICVSQHSALTIRPCRRRPDSSPTLISRRRRRRRLLIDRCADEMSCPRRSASALDTVCSDQWAPQQRVFFTCTVHSMGTLLSTFVSHTVCQADLSTQYGSVLLSFAGNSRGYSNTKRLVFAVSGKDNSKVLAAAFA